MDQSTRQASSKLRASRELPSLKRRGDGQENLGWLGIVRLGFVQMALGSVVVLMTSTVNRVMVVELALPALLPGALIGLHYAVQVLRPRWGYGSDVGGRRTPWIVGGMAVLVLGAMAAALAVAVLSLDGYRLPGLALAVAAFLAIGIGVGACGTSLLVLLAKRTDPDRRAAAATIVWVMMIAGFAVTAGLAGQFLDPYSPGRLLAVTGVAGGIAVIVTLLAIFGLEGEGVADGGAAGAQAAAPKPPFRQAVAEVWAEPAARRFTIFIFVSMLAYSAQELILEPFAGLVYGLTPGQSTKLSGVQHGGVLAGMILVALVNTRWRGGSAGRGSTGAQATALRRWATFGCVASAVSLLGIAAGGVLVPGWPLRASVFVLGLANGAFAIAAVGSMMAMVADGRQSREGVRMGLWGAAQGVAFGLGGVSGALAVDVARAVMTSPVEAYALVFSLEALVFLASAWLAARIGHPLPGAASGAPQGLRRAPNDTAVETMVRAPAGACATAGGPA